MSTEGVSPVAKLNDELNAKAIELVEKQNIPAVQALYAVAKEAGLKAVATHEDGMTQLFMLPNGKLTNCWIASTESQKIEPGGLGFDEDTDWYLGLDL